MDKDKIKIAQRPHGDHAYNDTLRRLSFPQNNALLLEKNAAQKGGIHLG